MATCLGPHMFSQGEKQALEQLEVTQQTRPATTRLLWGPGLAPSPQCSWAGHTHLCLDQPRLAVPAAPGLGHQGSAGEVSPEAGAAGESKDIKLGGHLSALNKNLSPTINLKPFPRV